MLWRIHYDDINWIQLNNTNPFVDEWFLTVAQLSFECRCAVEFKSVNTENIGAIVSSCVSIVDSCKQVAIRKVPLEMVIRCSSLHILRCAFKRECVRRSITSIDCQSVTFCAFISLLDSVWLYFPTDSNSVVYRTNGLIVYFYIVLFSVQNQMSSFYVNTLKHINTITYSHLMCVSLLVLDLWWL